MKKKNITIISILAICLIALLFAPRRIVNLKNYQLVCISDNEENTMFYSYKNKDEYYANTSLKITSGAMYVFKDKIVVKYRFCVDDTTGKTETLTFEYDRNGCYYKLQK